MKSIRIEEPGLLSTVQDRGRYGYQRYGMPVSGAMDVFALYVANTLAGNSPDAACIEATLTGPCIRFESRCWLAVTGADMEAKINGRAIERYRSYFVGEGDTLSFGRLISGCRTYIAFSGGIDVPVVMGSRSTCLQAKLGGHHGRPLEKGDVIPLGISYHKVPKKTVPKELLMPESYSGAIRLIPGPEIHHISSQGVISLLTSPYYISDQSNRMGYRLFGEAVELESPGGNMLSAGVTLGTMQLTGDGLPIILMADHQTTGGYARIAMVASVDIPLLAQMQAGAAVYFEETDITTSQALLRKKYERLLAWRNT